MSPNRSFDSSSGLSGLVSPVNGQTGLVSQSNGPIQPHMMNNSLYASNGEWIFFPHQSPVRRLTEHDFISILFFFLFILSVSCLSWSVYIRSPQYVQYVRSRRGQFKVIKNLFAQYQYSLITLGGTVVQWLALSPHSKRLLGSNPPADLDWWSLHVLLVGFLRVLQLPPTIQRHAG